MHIKVIAALAATALATLSSAGLAAPPSATSPSHPVSRGTASLWTPTACAGDIPADPADGDPDIAIRDDATLNVMFHGNRFVAARALVAEFERLNPGQRLSWTALPPAHTFRVIQDGPQSFAGSKPFFPDVFMGNRMLNRALQLSEQANRLRVQNRGAYSRIHGIVLLARADDAQVTGADIQAIVNNPKVRMVLPGQQPMTHPLVSAYGQSAALSDLAHLPANPRFGVSQQRHHRSIPARILARCEDAGFQFLQSQPYLEAEFPGQFKFIPASLPDDQAASEESFLFVLPGSPRAAAAERFLAFMTSPEAVDILRRYHLEP